MFKNIKRLNDILRMLKVLEGVTPSYKEFVEVLKENPQLLEVFSTKRKYFKEGAVTEIAHAIHLFRDSQ